MTNIKNDIKINYMPLAHDTYWNSYPEHLDNAMNLAKSLKEYLSQFGAIYEIGNLVDCQARSQEARLHFQAMDVDVLVLATVTYSTPDT